MLLKQPAALLVSCQKQYCVYYVLEHFKYCTEINEYWLNKNICLNVVLENKLYRVRHQLVLISCMVTLCSCLIWQIIGFIFPPNEYGCVYAWTTLGSGHAIDLQKMPILAKKNHLFRWYWRVCKQAKLPHLSTENPCAYIENQTHPKRVTVWCEFWSRGIIKPFFFESEQGEAVTVNGDHFEPCSTNPCSQ